MENRGLVDLVAALAAEPTLWVRVGATCPEESWRLALLEIIAGEPPPAWQENMWRYERALFTALTLSGKDVAGWLEAQNIALESVELGLGDLPTSVQVEQRESRFAGVLEPLPWPTVVWSVRLAEQYAHQLSGELVADSLRPFLDFDQAAAAFFNVPRSMTRGLVAREVVFRAQDRRGRIDSVRVRPTELVVVVKGEALDGATLALGGDRPGPAEQLAADSGEVHLPLAEPLPPRAWLALHHGHELLDRRYLDASGAQYGVEVEVDAPTHLAVLVAAGEGPATEFKRELPTSDIRTAIKSVAAFSNGDGGTIVYGVDDEGTVVGLDDTSVRKAADRLANLVRDYIRPLPLFDVEALDEAGTRVLLLNVDAGPETPYGVGTNDRNVVYYVRRGATSFPASPADVRAMVHARQPVNDPFGHLRLR